MIMSELIKRLKEERIQGSSAVLNYSNFDYWVNWDDIVEIVEDHDQPQLNENQQIVLDYLKEITIEDVSPMRAMEFLKYELKPNEYGGFQASTVGEAFYKLNNKEEAQVLKVFSQWVLEQEEE